MSDVNEVELKDFLLFSWKSWMIFK